MSCDNLTQEWNKLDDKEKYPLDVNMAPFCNKKGRGCGNCAEILLTAENAKSKHSKAGGRSRRRRRSRRKSKRRRTKKKRRRRRRKSTKKKRRRRRK